MVPARYSHLHCVEILCRLTFTLAGRFEDAEVVSEGRAFPRRKVTIWVEPPGCGEDITGGKGGDLLRVHERSGVGLVEHRATCSKD